MDQKAFNDSVKVVQINNSKVNLGTSVVILEVSAAIGFLNVITRSDNTMSKPNLAKPLRSTQQECFHQLSAINKFVVEAGVNQIDAAVTKMKRVPTLMAQFEQNKGNILTHNSSDATSSKFIFAIFAFE